MEVLPDRDIDHLYQTEIERFSKRDPKSLALQERGKGVMPIGAFMTWMVGLYDHLPILKWLSEIIQSICIPNTKKSSKSLHNSHFQLSIRKNYDLPNKDWKTRSCQQ
jgi:hypothetical protein